MSANGDNLSIEVLMHLKRAQDMLKKNQRKEAIEREVALFRNEGTKRCVRFTRNLLNQVEDMEDVLKTENGKDFASADNWEDVNAAVEEVKQMLKEHKESIQHELNMQVVAAKSPLKWKTVKCLEGGISLPSCVTLDSQEVRKAEKESMAFDRDLRTASNAFKRRREEYSFHGRGSGSSSVTGRGTSSYRGRGKGRGGVGGQVRACFRCGDIKHMIADCPKAKEAGEGRE